MTTKYHVRSQGKLIYSKNLRSGQIVDYREPFGAAVLAG
jgi:hypothetical protein